MSRRKRRMSLLGGLGIGALLMYLFDPEQGSTRRARLSNAACESLESAGDAAGNVWSNLSSHASKLGHRIAEHVHHNGGNAGHHAIDDIDRAANRLEAELRAVEAGIDPTDKAAKIHASLAGMGRRLLEQAKHLGKMISDRAGEYAASTSAAASGAREAVSDYGGSVKDYANDAFDDLHDRAHAFMHPHEKHMSATSVGVAAAGALTLGIGAMYLLDPADGRRRRGELADILCSTLSEAGQAFQTTGRFLRDQIDRIAHEMNPVAGKTQRGRDMSDAPSNDQNAACPLSGLLEWNTTTRLAAGVAGGALGFYGAVRRDWIGLGAGTIGLGLIAAGLTKFDFSQLGEQAAHFKDAAVNLTSRVPISVRKSIEIQAPASRVYEFWSDYANFPRIMSDVIEVKDLGAGKSRWKVKGPASIPVEWDAQITQRAVNEVLGWESSPGSKIYSSGCVRFLEMGPDRCRVDIDLSYMPPAGALGDALARLFGADPESDMDRNLASVKTQLEAAPAAHPGA